MIGSCHGRMAQTRFMLAAIVMLWGVSSCAAPDARPAPEPEAAPEPAGEPIWGKGFGDPLADQHAFDVALDDATGTVVSSMGFFSSIKIPGTNDDMSFNSGMATTRNIVIVKYEANGSKPVWASPIYDTAEIIRTTVDVDIEGNTIVAGGFNGIIDIPGAMPVMTAGTYDAFIAKFDPDGKPLWVHTFGGSTAQFITDVATDGAGNIIVVGMTSGDSFAFGDGVVAPKMTDADVFVAKFAPDHKALWAKRAGAAGSQTWPDPTATVAVSRSDGSILVGGSNAGILDFTPEKVGLTGEEGGFVVKLDAEGKGLWHLEFGDNGHKQRVTSVAFGPSNEVLLTGWFTGSVSLGGDTLTSYKDSEDLLVAKLDPNGKHVWSRGYGHLGKQTGTTVMVDEKGQAVVVGSFAGDLEFFGNDTLINTNNDTTSDIFAVKFGTNGHPFWARSYGDANLAVLGLQTIGGAVLWKDTEGKNRAILVGMNNGSIDLGADVPPIASQGLEDVYMMSITY